MERVGVIGGGQMGAGIAEVAALAGCEVVVHEVSPEAAEAARSRIEKSLDRGVSRGKVDKGAADAAAGRISYSTDWDDQSDRQLAIAAVTENEELNRQTFPRLAAPVTDRAADYCAEQAKKLSDLGYRVEVDYRNEKIGKKIREAQLEKIPYMVVVGDRDMENGTVSPRHRADGDLGAMTMDDFTALLKDVVDSKAKK